MPSENQAIRWTRPTPMLVASALTRAPKRAGLQPAGRRPTSLTGSLGEAGRGAPEAEADRELPVAEAPRRGRPRRDARGGARRVPRPEHRDPGDAIARHLLTRTPARDLEITSRNLEDAFLALTADEETPR